MEYDTIIIGAGMSGLACASKLLDHPLYQPQKLAEANTTKSKRNLLVLEGRDRIGGRIGSVRINGNRLDTGANWIHGVGSEDSLAGVNPLVKILPKKYARELGASVSFRPPATTKRPILGAKGVFDRTITETAADLDWVKVDASDTTLTDERGAAHCVIPHDVSTKLFAALWGLIGSLHQRSLEASPEEAKTTSLLEVITKDEDFRKAFDEIPREYHAVLAALPQFVENMEAGPLLGRQPGNMDAAPGLGLLEYAINDFDGEQVFLRDGYTAVVEEVGKKVIEQGLVKLGAVVEQIKWDGELVQVTTNDETYFAKGVVCTLPLGVLQHHTGISPILTGPKPLFTPILPSDKLEAIHSLGFGTLDKIFLVYSHPWWQDKPYKSIIRKGVATQIDSHSSIEPDAFWGFTTELPGLALSPPFAASYPGPRALSLINLHALTGIPALSCFVSCANALHIEALSDNASGDLVHRALTNWFGCDVPGPDAVHVTRWAGDQFSRGSYSHMVVGVSERTHREAFASPIVGGGGRQVRFAGEHTSEDHFATVHGALLSGWREAEEILKDESGNM